MTSGTQDVATDALAVLTFKKSDKSMVNSMQSMGSFGGALLGGGVLLMALHRYGWQTVLPFLAIFVLIALLPLLFNKHLTINEKPKETKAKESRFHLVFHSERHLEANRFPCNILCRNLRNLISFALIPCRSRL